MDITSLAIAIILSLFFIIPMWLLISSAKKKERRLRNSFLSVSKENNLTIPEHEHWKNKIIGLDNVNNRLLFVHLVDNQIKEELIDLNHISHCVIRHSGSTDSKGGEHGGTSDKLELLLIPKDKKAENINIPFFDLTNNSPFELKPMQDKAEKWLKYIENILK